MVVTRVMVAEKLPALPGVNVTVQPQEALAAKDAPQVWALIGKWTLSEEVMEVIPRLAVPVFWSVNAFAKVLVDRMVP